MIVEPKSIEITPEGLAVDWDGEHRSVLPHKLLREECRCANCVDEWSGKRILDVSKIPEEIQALDFIEVGRYAIQILWSDAHETGIYSFELLKSLCSCERCVAERA
ncbi:MAG: DUF971 domain-containing protein [Dehalococcoidia bacterium]